jgi:hypothetical protein
MRCTPLLLAAGLALAAAVDVKLLVNDDASYAVELDGKTWMSSAASSYVVSYDGAVHSTADGSLTPDSAPAPTGGSDVVGVWTGYNVSFNSGVFLASFRLYPARGAIIFQQTFPAGLSRMAIGGSGPDDNLATAFPVFDSNVTDLAYLTWKGCMCGGETGAWGTGKINFGREAGPLVVYNAAAAALYLSPASGFMTGELAFSRTTGNALGSGHNGMVTDVPAGWTYETLLLAGQGINETMVAAGDVLLARTGKTRTAPDADLIVSTLGWWSDNGAFYYYNSEPGKSMQETVVDSLAEWTAIGLPTRHVMYDSWWYYKECKGNPDNSWLTCKGAVELWEPRPDVFPDGFNFLLPLPLALHNRYFSGTNNSYVTSLGFADSFIVEAGVDLALPIKADVFKYMMSKAKTWGMVLYEQDWLNVVWEGMNVTRSNVTAGSLWLQAMSDAAVSLDLTIQYCMVRAVGGLIASWLRLSSLSPTHPPRSALASTHAGVNIPSACNERARERGLSPGRQQLRAPVLFPLLLVHRHRALQRRLVDDGGADGLSVL